MKYMQNGAENLPLSRKPYLNSSQEAKSNGINSLMYVHVQAGNLADESIQ